MTTRRRCDRGRDESDKGRKAPSPGSEQESSPGTVLYGTTGTLVMDGLAVPIDIVLAYDAADPYAVDLVASYGEFHAAWLLPRSILVTGMRRTAGTRAVKVRPRVDAEGRRYVSVTLFARHVGTVYLRQDELEAFLTETAGMVPVGKEGAAMDVDTHLQRLLTGDT